MSWYSDDDVLADIVAQTAEFRFRICWAGARRLLEGLGIDPMHCLLFSCDQGDDVSGTLMLPDGVLISFDMKEDSLARELIAISRWEFVEWNDREIAMAREIVSALDASAFDERARAHFEAYWMDRDEPLPPIA